MFKIVPVRGFSGRLQRIPTEIRDHYNISFSFVKISGVELVNFFLSVLFVADSSDNAEFGEMLSSQKILIINIENIVTRKAVETNFAITL